jgi:hypothetical protein
LKLFQSPWQSKWEQVGLIRHCAWEWAGKDEKAPTVHKLFPEFESWGVSAVTVCDCRRCCSQYSSYMAVPVSSDTQNRRIGITLQIAPNWRICQLLAMEIFTTGKRYLSRVCVKSAVTVCATQRNQWCCLCYVGERCNNQALGEHWVLLALLLTTFSFSQVGQSAFVPENEQR